MNNYYITIKNDFGGSVEISTPSSDASAIADLIIGYIRELESHVGTPTQRPVAHVEPNGTYLPKTK